MQLDGVPSGKSDESAPLLSGESLSMSGMTSGHNRVRANVSPSANPPLNLRMLNHGLIIVASFMVADRTRVRTYLRQGDSFQNRLMQSTTGPRKRPITTTTPTLAHLGSSVATILK